MGKANTNAVAHTPGAPLVHVLVINWNGMAHLKACFDSLLASTYANVRFILVDNASDDDSVAFVRERYGHDARLDIVECPSNLGWSGGNNYAMTRSLAAGAEYLFLLNNDTATAAGAIERLVEMAAERPEIGALAPKMVLFDYPEVLNSVGLTASRIGASWDIGIGRVDAPRWNRRAPVIGVCGGAWLIRTEALRKTGLLPEEFGIYLDDLDLCLRLWNAGYSLWSCPEAVVRHKFSATLGQGDRARHKYFLNTRNRFWLMLRNFPLSKLPGVFPALLLGEIRALGRACLDRAFWRVPAHVRAWCAALTYLPAALRERRRQRANGLAKARFWHLIRWDPMFCPGLMLPEQGWYETRQVAGHRVRGMASRAWCDIPPGRLRLVCANCYPALGSTDLRALVDGEEAARLATDGVVSVEIESGGGRLEFEAQRLFEAEETGAVVDYGGWVGVVPCDPEPADRKEQPSP